MENIVTSDLGEFGYRELEMARQLLNALLDNNQTEIFGNSGVQICMNKHSGYVFLTDDDYNVAMVSDDGELLDWFTTPYEGREGFLADLIEEYDDMHPEDQEYIDSIREAA